MNRTEVALMRSLDYAGRTVVEGRSRVKDAWGSLRREGVEVDEGWGTLRDGRGVYDVLEQADVEALSDSYIRIDHTGTYGDLLWSGSMMTAFVSLRFAEAVRTAGFGGFTLVPLDVQPKRGPRFSGYSLLIPANTDPDADIRSFPFPFRPTVALDVSQDVVDALRSAGVTDLKLEPASERAELLLSSA